MFKLNVPIIRRLFFAREQSIKQFAKASGLSEHTARKKFFGEGIDNTPPDTVRIIAEVKLNGTI